MKIAHAVTVTIKGGVGGAVRIHAISGFPPILNPIRVGVGEGDGELGAVANGNAVRIGDEDAVLRGVLRCAVGNRVAGGVCAGDEYAIFAPLVGKIMA